MAHSRAVQYAWIQIEQSLNVQPVPESDPTINAYHEVPGEKYTIHEMQKVYTALDALKKKYPGRLFQVASLTKTILAG